MRADQALTIYPLVNYTFGHKDRVKAEAIIKDQSLEGKLARMKAQYDKQGMRRSVEGVMLVNLNGHPHILMQQQHLAYFKLPGGRLRAGEDETQGLKRKLSSNLAPPNPGNNPALHLSWDIGECIGQFWRPNFDTLFYPYLPPHITRPKECRRIFIIPLPTKALFALNKGTGKLVAVPLFDLYDNPAKYGPVISALPSMLSRFKLTLVGSEQAVVTKAPSLDVGQREEQQDYQQDQQWR